MSRPFAWQMAAALVLVLGGMALETMQGGTAANIWPALGLVLVAAIAGSLFATAPLIEAGIAFIGAHGAAWLLISGIAGHEGNAGPSFYLALVGAWLLAWRCVTALSAIKPASRQAAAALGLIIPVIFGVWILILWEAIVRGAGIPFLLLPAPSAIGARIVSSASILAADVNQTVFKAVLAGYAIGCISGFAAAVAADRFIFLRRGLLPIGNMAAALPIIGVAPIMVMWFGFGWESKAAVVVVMTFFPMLVNTVAGLSSAGHMERDLMRTYASGYWQMLFKLRLPAAMPFIFNALKINSTLALIGAIVAEFFGTPVVGMGFRISTEVGRMNIDMVWAEIAVAAVAGSVFYGGVALLERAVTFWHPSIRGG
ncbi:ABC transporter permease [Manganibacter manganicus]|uniref:Nitrate ABC transporter n=1 Tax=Manganibacter manganicus TaxID=1873176 RepID=A0A1V8RW36_9HYPH|nr:ABC transporter permease [Pseudaminobacter manganicus]OQM77324.1 nitrate ABC transporter [Pseudaminobacter manganicus]